MYVTIIWVLANIIGLFVFASLAALCWMAENEITHRFTYSWQEKRDILFAANGVVIIFILVIFLVFVLPQILKKKKQHSIH
jgi:formate hydrogenlyase subunit 3/multisubunit Na+/H+ antiporter MnhD subunit